MFRWVTDGSGRVGFDTSSFFGSVFFFFFSVLLWFVLLCAFMCSQGVVCWCMQYIARCWCGVQEQPVSVAGFKIYCMKKL